MAKIVALVPMRHSSERVPGKNYRSFAGSPLYHYIVKNLLACPLIAEVVIDTDSPKIKEDAAEYFPQVKLLERPEHLRAGTVPMNDVLLNNVSLELIIVLIQKKLFCESMSWRLVMCWLVWGLSEGL